MKKILLAFLFSTLFVATKTVAQSNIVWTVKDKIQKGEFKTITTFNSEFTGFKNDAEVSKFCTDLKAHKDVLSCNVISKTNSSCNVQLNMKTPHNGRYYLDFSKNMGIAYVVANQKRNSVAEALAKAQSKN